MQHWYITEGWDSASQQPVHALNLADVPWWALAGSWAVETLDVCLGHALCGGGPAWPGRLPLGRPAYEEDEGGRWLTNSLADKLFRFFQWGMSLDSKYSRPQQPHRVIISAEQAAAFDGGPASPASPNKGQTL